MTVEYLTGTVRRVEHVDRTALHAWTTQHPDAVIVHATPDRAVR